MKNTSNSPTKFDQLSLCANVSMPRFSKPSYSHYPIMNVNRRAIIIIILIKIRIT